MYLAFDTETTGLTEDCNVLTVYFVILDNNLKEIASLDLKIKHAFYKVYTKALEINKIDLIEHDKTAISIEDAMTTLYLFLESHYNGAYIPLGHNILYDIKMLKLNNILSQELYDIYFSSKYVDTLVISRFLKSCKLIPNKQSLSLSKICYYFDINIDSELSAHNSEYDTKMTILLFEKLQNIIKDNDIKFDKYCI